MLTLESSGGLVPGWSRECPMGVPLICSYLNLSRTRPSLARVDVSIAWGGSDFRDSVFILSYYLLPGCPEG